MARLRSGCDKDGGAHLGSGTSDPSAQPPALNQANARELMEVATPVKRRPRANSPVSRSAQESGSWGRGRGVAWVDHCPPPRTITAHSVDNPTSPSNCASHGAPPASALRAGLLVPAETHQQGQIAWLDHMPIRQTDLVLNEAHHQQGRPQAKPTGAMPGRKSSRRGGNDDAMIL